MITGDPTLDKPLAALRIQLDRIAAEVLRASDYNDPRTASGTGGASPNKPESKAPGHQQCVRLIRDAERVLTRCANDLATLCANADIREHTPITDYTDAEQAAVKRIRQERSQLIAARKAAQ